MVSWAVSTAWAAASVACAAACAASALLLAIIHVPVLQGAFGTVTLDPLDWAVILGVAVTIVPVLELVKWFNRRSI